MKMTDWTRRNKRVVASCALAFLVYAGVAILLTWPLAANPNRYYFSPEVPGDGIGIIAENWNSAHPKETDTQGPVTRFYGYPFGVDRRGIPVYPLDKGVRFQLTGVIGAQAASNVIIFFSFPLAGLVMFVLVFYITRSHAAAFLGGFLYTFSPWHVSRAFDQVSLTATYTLPLFALALIIFWKRRDVPSALGLAAAWIIAFYSDLHFGLFCLLIAFSWMVSASYLGWRRKRTGRAPLAHERVSSARTLLLIALIITLTAAAVAPYLSAALYKDPKLFPGSGRGGVKEATDFSANTWNYVVPPAHAVAWRWFTDGFVRARLGQRTSNEVTSYPGIITFAMALVALVLAIKKRKVPPEANGCSQDLINVTIAFCCIVVAGAFVLSLPPQYRVWGVKIPTPSILVAYLVPMFRYFTRWAVVVTFGLCLLAGLGFHMLAVSLKWRRRVKWAACVVLLILFVVDVTIIPPFRAQDIRRQPEVIKKLAEFPKNEPVVIYPLVQGGEYAQLYYRYLQQFHGHPMLNGTKQATESDLYRLALKDIYSPYTPRMLKALGIKKVVVLDKYFSNKDYGNYPYGIPFDPAKMPPGYELAARTSDGYIYDVVAEPASVFPLYYRNFTPPSILEDGRAWVAMLGRNGEILLVNDGSSASYSLTLTIADPSGKGHLAFSLDGRQVSSVELSPGARRVTLQGLDLAHGRHVLSLHWDGKPVSIDGTAFRSQKSLDVYLLLSAPELQEESR